MTARTLKYLGRQTLAPRRGACALLGAELSFLLAPFSPGPVTLFNTTSEQLLDFRVPILTCIDPEISANKTKFLGAYLKEHQALPPIDLLGG